MKILKALIIILIITINVNSQNKDLLFQKSFEVLKDSITDNFQNKIRLKEISNIYLSKAKTQKDTINMAYGYMYSSYSANSKNSIKYCDSIILLTENYKNNYFPAYGYMLKGYYNYDKGNDIKALSLYLKADEYAKKTGNIDQQTEIQQFIATMKTRVGDNEEAKKIFLKELKRLESNPTVLNLNRNSYEINLNALSKYYLLNHNLDSADIFINKGLKSSFNNKKSSMYPFFLLDSGTLHYFKKDYSRAMDSLKKAEPKLEKVSLSMCYYYQSKILQKKKNDSNIYFLKMIDSVYTLDQNPFVELKNVYRSLIDYSENKNKPIEQLEYLEKLLVVDSILNLNNIKVNDLLTTNYEIPKLLDEKTELLKKIQKDKIFKVTSFLIFALFLLSSIIYFQKNKRLKTQFNDLIKHGINNSPKKNIKLNLSKKMQIDLLEKLNQFEIRNDFLDNNTTLNSLSKLFGTNTSYLSKFINEHKGISFTNYLNGLRIDYAIKELKKNKTLKSYTIKAIALEVGFSGAESFSRAFHKKTGMRPAYFIKNLVKG